ncbi:hypothetical protein HMPREF5505_0343 [Lactobacillus delbrueckii subsp. lactis DSM 20072]|nr:hypothetical protein HMPREF5505_0343 [Lactobacillus delbrueckii subsp. lactis DSM 20072]
MSVIIYFSKYSGSLQTGVLGLKLFLFLQSEYTILITRKADIYMTEADQVRKRINELYKKKQESGLTEAEEAERKELHKQFIANFRAGFKQQLDSLVIVDDQGKDVTPEKAKQIQKKKLLR